MTHPETPNPKQTRPNPWPLAALVALAALCGLATLSSRRADAQRSGPLPLPRPIDPIEPPIIAPPPIDEPPIWRRPIPIPPQLGQELHLQSVRARVEIANTIARTTVTQTFRNTASRPVEGTYLFPLPDEAALSGFTLTQNGKTLRAETIDRDKAREIYEGIVAKLRDPGLLEYADRGLLRARIFPVPANGTAQVELSYSQALRADNGTLRYALPTKLPLGGAPENASIDVHLRDSDARNLYSPTQKLDIKRDGQGWRASGEWSNDERPVSLLWSRGREAVATSLLTYQPPGEDGYFLLLAAPDTNTQRQVAAKDVVFVADTSGSMAGQKIEQTRNALKTLLGNLNAGDRFNIVAFASDVNPWKPGLVAATPANLQSARAFAEDLRAIGSTNIDDALQEAAKNLKKSDGGERPTQIVFMTDGQPTVGETDPNAIRKNARAEIPRDARVFTFGVGYDVNTRLLDALAEDNDGASDYVAPNEDIEAKVGALYAKIAYPVLTNPRLEWTGAQVYDQYPKRLPDVFRGAQVAAFGRFKGSAPQVRLSGALAGQGDVRFASVGSAQSDGDTGNAVARLWATRKIGTMLDDARREGTGLPDDVRADLVRLAKKWNIVTPLTSGLATEDEAPVFFDGQTRARLQNSAGGGFGGSYQNRATLAAPQAAADAFGAGANAPSSGQVAVDAARATQSLRRAESAPKAATPNALSRNLGGKTFVKQGETWTDADYNATKFPRPRIVKFGSKQYFALARNAQVAKWLSVGERVLFVQNGEAIKIEP